MLVNAYATNVSPAPISFSHELGAWRDWHDPALHEHLVGMSGFVQTQCAGGLTPLQYGVLSHIARVRNHWSFEVSSEHSARLATWAMSVNAIFFLPDSTIRDPFGRVLVEPGTGVAHDGAEVPYLTQCVARKEAVTAALAARGFATNDSLPPIASDEEVVLPSVAAVMDRLAALAAVAVQAEAALQGQPMSLEQLGAPLPRAGASLTSNESAFVVNPTEADATQMIWRYECLPVLLWALGLQDRLDPPAAVVDAAFVTRAVVQANLDAIESTTMLRPINEILDQADLTYRLHWAVQNAQVGSTEAPPQIEPGAVTERRHAFEWLIEPRVAWDNVRLDT